MVLFVGEPVKNRDTSELNDPQALMPQMINKIPMISSATEISLFKWNSPCVLINAVWVHAKLG